MPEKLDYGLTPATASQARRCLAKITLGAVLAAANPAPAQQTEGPARTVTIPRGTYLRLATVKQLDPATANPGDDVPLRLLRPLTVDGAVLIAAGQTLHGTVTKVTPRGKRCVRGEVQWKLEPIQFAGGGSARAQIVYKSPIANDQYQPGPAPHVSRGEITAYVIQDIAVAPLLPVALAVEAGSWLVTRPFKRNSCPKYTQDRPLPARATVLVRISDDTRVQAGSSDLSDVMR